MKTGVYMSVSAALRLSISVSKNSTRWLRIFLTYTLRKRRGTCLCVFRESLKIMSLKTDEDRTCGLVPALLHISFSTFRNGESGDGMFLARATQN
jgi:hypothetical protein